MRVSTSWVQRKWDICQRGSDNIILNIVIHKKYLQPKKLRESYVLFGGGFKTESPGDSISSNCERTAQRKGGWEPGYIELCNRGQVNCNVKRLL